MTKSKKRRYDNEALRTPIQLSNFAMFPLPTGYDPQKLYTKKRAEKMGLLFEDYGIAPDDPDGWRKIAYSLAYDHVPGFKHVKKGGRPKKWERIKNMKLYADVKMFKRSKGKSVPDACRILVTAPRFKSRYGDESDETGQSLERRYYEALDDIYTAIGGSIEAGKAIGIDEQSMIERYALRKE